MSGSHPTLGLRVSQNPNSGYPLLIDFRIQSSRDNTDQVCSNFPAKGGLSGAKPPAEAGSAAVTGVDPTPVQHFIFLKDRPSIDQNYCSSSSSVTCPVQVCANTVHETSLPGEVNFLSILTRYYAW